jgi:hypothetical protein
MLFQPLHLHPFIVLSGILSPSETERSNVDGSTKNKPETKAISL